MCEEGKTGVCVFEGGSTLSNVRIQSVVLGVSSRGGMEVKIMEIQGKKKIHSRNSRVCCKRETTDRFPVWNERCCNRGREGVSNCWGRG